MSTVLNEYMMMMMMMIRRLSYWQRPSYVASCRNGLPATPTMTLTVR